VLRKFSGVRVLKLLGKNHWVGLFGLSFVFSLVLVLQNFEDFIALFVITLGLIGAAAIIALIISGAGKLITRKPLHVFFAPSIWIAWLVIGLALVFNLFVLSPFSLKGDAISEDMVGSSGPKDTDRDGIYDEIDRCPGTFPGIPVDDYGCELPEAIVMLPELPWPPPKPSSKIGLPRDMLANSENLLDVSDRLSSILQSAGYGEQGFYRVPAKQGAGFAIVTRIERFDRNGNPLPDDVRFLPPDLEDGSFDLSEFILRIFIAPKGYYRFAIFVVTDTPFIADAPQISAEQAEVVLQSGATRLPIEYKQLTFDDFQIDVLIYEYRWDSETEKAESTVPGRLSAKMHLEKSGLTEPLGLK
jgi:hypothetical protein